MLNSYNNALIFKNHLVAFLKLMEALPEPSKPGAFEAAVTMWRATNPDSVVLKYLTP